MLLTQFCFPTGRCNSTAELCHGIISQVILVKARITGSGAADVGIVFRGAFVVVVARALVTITDTKTKTEFNKGARGQSTQESSLGLAPVMAAFIQVLFHFTVFLASKAEFLCADVQQLPQLSFQNNG
jgi:hypothetical protein